MQKLLATFLAHKTRIQILGAMLLFMLVVWYAVGTKNEIFYAIPPAIAFFVITVNNFKHVWFLLVGFLPLSTNLQNLFPSISLTVPTDVLCLTLMFSLIVKMILEKQTHFSFFNHPIFWIICLWLGWMIIPAAGSDLPVVSYKWFAAHVWLITGFYVMSVLVFDNPKNIVYFFWFIAMSFMVALVIIILLYLSTGRNPFSALRFNPMPFFNDHTVFGAFTSLLVPIFFLFSFRGDFSRTFRFFSFGALMFILLGLLLSFSRGAWASVFIGFFCMFLFSIRRWIMKLWPLFLALAIGAGVYINHAVESVRSRNASVSRKSLTEHVGSIANWQTDYSNAERLNRWMCAIEMFKESPVLGKGPGTYAMYYGDYQHARYRTPVSTNRGDNGTAHNEFLLALGEQGVVGGILMLLLFLVPIWYGLRGYVRSKEHNIKLLYLGCSFGLIIYFFHAMVNNFIDQDKVGGVFFGMLAVITALDLYRDKQSKKPMENRTSV